MIATDKRGFVQAFNVLAVATRLTDSDAAMQRIYFEGLEDIDLEAVTSAARVLAKTSKFFPRLAEWRELARMHAIALIKTLPPTDRETPWAEECPTCSDTGWEERRCYPGTPNTCGRKKCNDARPEHTYVVVCTCRPNNRTYRRHHA